MKIKQVEAILKAQKTIIVFETPECQWLGDGSAFYPVYNLPKLTRENIFTIFDIAEEKRGKFYFEERELPPSINFEDDDSTERMLERSAFSLVADGRHLEPLKTSQGMAYINKRYLTPFFDSAEGFDLYERTSTDGTPYIVAKAGFILLGVIAPYDLVNESFIETLKDILELSCVALFNKEQRQIHKKVREFEEEQTTLEGEEKRAELEAEQAEEAI